MDLRSSLPIVIEVIDEAEIPCCIKIYKVVNNYK